MCCCCSGQATITPVGSDNAGDENKNKSLTVKYCASKTAPNGEI